MLGDQKYRPEFLPFCLSIWTRKKGFNRSRFVTSPGLGMNYLTCHMGLENNDSGMFLE